jgi:peptidoglycan biosynthesis protein MviN/MurJ (putative lipid II flippase)
LALSARYLLAPLWHHARLRRLHSRQPASRSLRHADLRRGAGGSFIPVYSQHLTSRKARESASLASATLTLVVLILGPSRLVLHSLPLDYASAARARFFAGAAAAYRRADAHHPAADDAFGLSGVLSGILNAHQHFVLPALAPIALNAGYFVGLFGFVPAMDGDIHGLAWGTVVGGLATHSYPGAGLAALPLPLSTAARPIAARRARGGRLMGPRIVTLGTIQFADLFIIRLTSGLPSGSTSGYFYAYYLQQLPETLFGTAIGIVVFPTLAELYNAGEIERLKRTAMSALKIVWTLTIPAGAVLVLLGRPAIAWSWSADSSTPLDCSWCMGCSFSLACASSPRPRGDRGPALLCAAQHADAQCMPPSSGWSLRSSCLPVRRRPWALADWRWRRPLVSPCSRRCSYS